MRILHVTRFANVIVECRDGRIWRVSPDGLEAGAVARDEAAFAQLMRDEEHNTDVFMSPLVARATEALGTPGPGLSFHLVVPGALGGEYATDNVSVASTLEILSQTGRWSREIAGLPEGTEVNLKPSD